MLLKVDPTQGRKTTESGSTLGGATLAGGYKCGRYVLPLLRWRCAELLDIAIQKIVFFGLTEI
jgi:hypothetical protein